MLKTQIELLVNEQENLKLLAIEKAYALKHELLSTGAIVEETTLQFDVIERCNKETEELLAEETQAFLATPIQYVKDHSQEFVYVASDRFDVVRLDSLALEFDEVFGVYSALFGLRLQKKHSDVLHTYLKAHLRHEKMTYSAAFSSEDGLWEVNLSLDAMDGFNEQQSFDEVLTRLYNFVFELLEGII